MKHPSLAAVFSVVFLISFSVEAQSRFVPCFQRSGIQQPQFEQSVREASSWQKSSIERPQLEGATMYKEEIEKPKFEKPAFQTRSYDVRCNSSVAPTRKSSLPVIALKRNDLNYNLPREGKTLASRKSAFQKVKVGTMKPAPCPCDATSSSNGKMGSGTAIVSAR